MHFKIFIHNANTFIGFFILGFIVAKENMPLPKLPKRGYTLDEGKFVGKMDDCNATYTNEYNLIRHL